MSVPPRPASHPGTGLPNADPLLGFHGPGTAMWRINREAVLLGAGPAALLLQIAHPHVAEGVAHHSDFEADPWRRLRRTLRTTLALVFGDGPTAELAVRRLNGVHATVRGEATDPDARALAGETYRAMDPELLLWVQVTLVWTSVQAYERWVEPLDDADREELWAEAREVGRRLGIPLDVSPPDWPALEAYWDRMLGPGWPDRQSRRPLVGSRHRSSGHRSPASRAWPSTCWRRPAWRCCRSGSAWPMACRGARSAHRWPAWPTWPAPVGRARCRSPGARCRRLGRPTGAPWRLGQPERGAGRSSGPVRAATIHRTRPSGAAPPVPSQDLSRRAVVTGLGAVTPIGNDHPTFWRNLVAGVSGAGPITSFDPTGYDVRIAAEVKDFDPTVAMDRKMARRMSRFIHLAMAAGKEAVEDSGLDFSDWSPERRDRVAVCVNTGGGGLDQVIDGAEVVRVKGPNFVSPFAIPALSGSMAACQLSMAYGLTGPVITQVAACASSVIAFLDALRMIQRGEVDVVLAGGSEAPLVAMAFAALGNMGALSKRNDDPTHASRPFDRDRDGFLFGEGAGVVVVESAAHALARGARIEAELVGAALTADAFHISAPEPTGRGATMAMTKAMADAGLAPDEIDYIVAHGTSTPLNDVTETRALKAAFGAHAHKVPISSPKSMIGHLLGAAGVASAR